jgi:hypothetical protein
MNFLSIKKNTNIFIIIFLVYIQLIITRLKKYYSPYAFEQGVPNKKHHWDTKSEPPYLAFTLGGGLLVDVATTLDVGGWSSC